MYKFGLNFVLFIQKLSAGKEFRLVRPGFRLKKYETGGVKFENRNNFI